MATPPIPSPPPHPGLNLPPAPPLISGSFQQFLNTSPDYLIFAAAVIVFAFAFFYTAAFQSGATAAGRALRSFVISLSVLFVSNIATLWLGQTYPYRWLVRDGVYLYVLISSGRLLLLLLRNWRVGAKVTIQPRTRHDRPESGQSHG